MKALPAPAAGAGEASLRESPAAGGGKERVAAAGVVRIEAVKYRNWRVSEGATAREAAAELAVSERTLREWSEEARKNSLSVKRCGRKPRPVSQAERLEVLKCVLEIGPAVGLELLKEQFGALPRRALRDLLWGFREHYSRTHPIVEVQLRWAVRGAVWAMDHSRPPAPVAGRLGEGFSVKELSEGRQLLWLPVEDTSAERAVEAIDGLTEGEELPLVIKADRGSPFAGSLMAEYLESRGVFLLLSPRRWPQYNGALESRIRWLKVRSRYQAQRLGGRGDVWSEGAMERARVLTNELYASRIDGPRVGDGLRAAFRRSVESTIAAASAEYVYDAAVLAKVTERIKRFALERALEEHGVLQVRRRIIPLPKKSIFAARIR